MPSKAEYQAKAKIVIDELFPKLSAEARAALTFLVVDFLMSLDAAAMGDQ
jgi:hypothetical protein